MKALHWLLMGILCIVFTSCGSDDEPEPTYNWWELTTVNLYEVGTTQDDLKWIKETRHDEGYVLDKTESYMEKHKEKFDGLKLYSDQGKCVYIFSYEYKKVDYIPIR